MTHTTPFNDVETMLIGSPVGKLRLSSNVIEATAGKAWLDSAGRIRRPGSSWPRTTRVTRDGPAAGVIRVAK